MENARFTGPRIFLSSTSEFDAVCPHILASLQPDYPVWHWKQEVALNASAESHCREMIRNTQVAVLLLGNTYGTNYDDNCSICEWEYNCATGPPAVPGIMAFVKEGWQTAADPRQGNYINRITNFSQGHWCKIFNDDATLINQIRESVMKWHIQYLQKVKLPDRKLKTTIFKIIVFALILAGLVLTFVVLAHNGFPPTQAFIGAIALLGTTAAAMTAYHLLTT